MNKTKKVILSVTNDLVTDQRVHKVAKTLQKNGFLVLLIGRKFSFSENINREYNTKRFSLIFNKGFLFYAEFNIRLFFFLLFTKFDILNANDLDTLPANYFAAKLKKKKLVYDSHEFFTEVPELIHRKKVRNIWLKIEEYILPKLKYAYTVSPSIAEEYKKKYNISFKVIMNLPFYRDFEKKEKKSNNKVILYQGALNINRGIELLIESMQFIENTQLIIAGSGDIETELRNLSNKLNLTTDKVFFTGRLSLERLFFLTQKSDLGLSPEENAGNNYKYSLPNKLFDYINAEIPVLVSDLPEMKKIITNYKVGEIIKSRNPKDFAEQVKSIIFNSEKSKTYIDNCKKAKKVLNWENQEKDLVDIYL